MKPREIFSRLAAAIAAAAVIAAAVPNNSSSKKPPFSDAERLIEQLNSKVFREREEAERKLLQLDEDTALPALRRALSTPLNLEVQRRATRVLQEITRRREEREARARLAWGADAFVEAMFLRKKEMDDRWWRSALLLAEDISKRAKDKWVGPHFTSPSTFLESPKRLGEGFKGEFKGCVSRQVTSPVPGFSEFRRFFLLCPQHVATTRVMYANIIFANNDFVQKATAFGGNVIDKCIVVCDGDVIAERIVRSAVIASGKVTTMAGDWNREESFIAENVRAPSPFVQFFSTGLVGIEVADTKGNVRVEKVHAGRAFAQSGVRPGDNVTSVGNREVHSADEFRRLIRSTALTGGQVTLSIRRGGLVQEVSVQMGKAPF
jgi:hypothetical protein